MVAVALSRARPQDFIALTKPRIVLLVMLTVAVGYWLGGPPTAQPFLLFHVLLATALVAAGSNALNQVAERDVDALMRRTRGRPLPAGRLSVPVASGFAWLASVWGIVHMAVFVNALAAVLAGITLISYVFLYTPLKRRTTVATLVGAVPGALPIVGGWVAATGSLSSTSWVLFWILFLWQLPHFLALGWLYRDDYARAGLKMVGVEDPDGHASFRYASLYAAALLPVALMPTLLGVAGIFYFSGALVLSIAFLWLSVAAARRTTAAAAKRLFRASLVYLPMLLILMGWDKGL